MNSEKFYKELFFLNIKEFKERGNLTYIRPVDFKSSLKKYIKDLENKEKFDKKAYDAFGNSFYGLNHPNANTYPRPSDNGPEL